MNKPKPAIQPFKIDNGIQIPKVIRRGRAFKYPFPSLLKSGDSFFVPEPVKGVRASAVLYGKTNKIDIITRSVTEQGVSGVRVFRV